MACIAGAATRAETDLDVLEDIRRLHQKGAWVDAYLRTRDIESEYLQEEAMRIMGRLQ